MTREKPAKPSRPASRRKFVKTAGTLAGAGLITAGIPFGIKKGRAQAQSKDELLAKRPNFVFIVTDQQRYPQHWPEGLIRDEAKFPNWNRLTRNGISFRRAFCNTSMCSPSRATLFTGLYPAQHGVVDTLTESDFPENHLPPPAQMQNMAKVLASAGYHVVYKGKWHLSETQDAEGNDLPATAEQVESYGFLEWDGPESGQDTEPENFGILADHDPAYAANAAAFLEDWKRRGETRPFALIVSLVNPHDVLAYPGNYNQAEEYAYVDQQGVDHGVNLPDTLREDLSGKPSVHTSQLSLLNLRLGRLVTPMQRRTYVNFYADLQIKTEQHIETVMQALEGLENDTIVFRLSDHGEMGLSHGGLRQKAFNMYEETVNVPLIVSNPLLYPEGAETDSLASLVDVLPTVASLAKVPGPERWIFRGRDLTPVLLDPTAEVQDAVLYTYDDQRAGNTQLEDPAGQPNHIRALIKKNVKYAVYEDPSGEVPSEYEWYDLAADPAETANLATWDANPDNAPPAERALREELDRVSAERLAPLERSTRVSGWRGM